MTTINDLIKLLLVKYNLNSTDWLKKPTKKFASFQAYDYFYAILSSSNLEEAASLLNCSSRTLSRVSWDLNAGKPFSQGGGSLAYYFAKDVGYFTCKTCKEILPEKAFDEGRKSCCKKCRAKDFKEYYKENKASIVYKSNLRLIHISRATPAWANLDRIKEIYFNCPESYHVDHIVPLQGLLVCGLHVENNLQYLTAEENLKKSNKWEVS